MLIICAIVGAVIVATIVIVAAVIATLPEQVIISEGTAKLQAEARVTIQEIRNFALQSLDY